ncbi:Clavaminate synthase-like protein [Mycena venus]|uniref:Clavaminate synthase-like protein n=1 Tax=Mycena venus TaxID=2733690 RepID=A0A8H6WMT2_9AGAR|nr:Clavaminate synthase-like protein [Mycena venus]
MSSPNFSSVPVLDYSPDEFIKELQHALINVGFLYLSNVPIETDKLVAYIPRLFALPQEAKDKISMVNSKHFLGYTKLGTEFTKGRTDWREQFDIATPHVCRAVEGRGDPDYWSLWGPSQWPDEDILPGFKATFERYLLEVQQLSYDFIGLLAEAFGLPSDALKQFYDTDEFMQHRGKIVQYPQTDSESQGVGPHYDAGFLTFLLQASDHKGLQVQNLSGDWIDVPPIPGTFVVNIGRALEFATQGLARATSHRVLSPVGGTGPRYSVPFFQNIGLNVKLTEHVLDFPPEILKLRDARAVNFTEFDREPSGRVNLIGRVKSHPDVAERHYPELFKQVFPNGVPQQVSAY